MAYALYCYFSGPFHGGVGDSIFDNVAQLFPFAAILLIPGPNCGFSRKASLWLIERAAQSTALQEAFMATRPSGASRHCRPAVDIPIRFLHLVLAWG